MVKQMISKDNSKRITSLSCDQKLGDIAYNWSKGQCAAGAISHNGFGGRCAEAANRACGENVAYNRPPQMSETVADTHQRWMDSPGHRANIQNEGFDLVGYGWFVCVSSDRMYWTGFFGKAY